MTAPSSALAVDLPASAAHPVSRAELQTAVDPTNPWPASPASLGTSTFDAISTCHNRLWRHWLRVIALQLALSEYVQSGQVNSRSSVPVQAAKDWGLP